MTEGQDESCNELKQILAQEFADERERWLVVSDHLTGCRMCASTNHAGAEEAVFKLLEEVGEPAIGAEASEADDVASEDLLRLRSQLDRELVEAVGLLYEHLPLPLRKRAEETWEPLFIGKGVLALAMVVQRACRGREKYVILSRDGLQANGDFRLTAKDLGRELEIMTGLESASAIDLLGWLVDAARAYERLMPGATSRPRHGKEDVEVVFHGIPIDIDWAKQWAPHQS